MEDIIGFDEQMSGWFDSFNPFRAVPKPPMPKMIETIKQAKPSSGLLTLAQRRLRLINKLKAQEALKRKMSRKRNFWGM